MDQLDDLDLRIIELLIDDGRMSNVNVARHLAVSEATARRRIDRLVRDKIIDVVAVPHPERVAAHEVQVIVAIQTEAGAAEALADHLAALDEMRYVAVVSGPFDVLAEIVVPTHADLLQVLRTHIAGRRDIKAAQTMMILHISRIGHRRVSAEPSNPPVPAEDA